MQVDTASPIPVYLQIEQLLEQLILKQQLSAHELLPGVAVLAKQLKVAPLTVQKAFRRLQARGLIYSIAGKGTFVADDSHLQFAGILVHNQYLLDTSQSPTLPLLLQSITDHLAALRIPARILTDTYPRFQSPAPISPDVMSILENGRPMGLILMGHYGSDPLFELARQRGFPTIGLGINSPNVTVRLRFNRDGLLRASLQHIRERKIKDTAIFWLDQDNGPAERLDTVHQIEGLMVEAGIHPNPDWIIGVQQTTDWAGYHAFNHLWSLPNRPHGLIVLDDVIGRGVHMGILARQLRVPDDIVIAVFSNEDSPIHFPEYWQQGSNNLHQCGKIAVESLNDILAGRPVDNDIHFPFKWRGPDHRSPWKLTINATVGDGMPLFRTGRQVLEKV